MDQGDGLIHALLLDGSGGAAEGGWELVHGGVDAAGAVWVHLLHESEVARRWLREESGLDDIVVEALLAQDTRPRSFAFGDGIVAILRGVNLNPGAEPDDMVSIRGWIQPGRIVTVCLRRLRAVEDLREALAAGQGPVDGGGFVAAISARLVARMAPVLHAIEERLDEIEDSIIEDEPLAHRSELVILRRRMIRLRRYLAPQREAFARLSQEEARVLSSADRSRMREASDSMLRYVEDLDALRDRASVTQEELASRRAERMERTSYVLTIVAAIFLPLGLITGLLGINVAGIPGTETPWAFAGVCMVLGVLAIVEVWLFRRLKWL